MQTRDLGIILLIGLLCASITYTSLPYTTSQFIDQTTDLNYYKFENGDYNNMLLIIDGNKISVADSNDLNINPDLTGYVPYIGATTDLNMGDFNISAGYFIGDGSQLTGIVSSGGGFDGNLYSYGIASNDDNSILIDLNMRMENDILGAPYISVNTYAQQQPLTVHGGNGRIIATNSAGAAGFRTDGGGTGGTIDFGNNTASIGISEDGVVGGYDYDGAFILKQKGSNPAGEAEFIFVEESGDWRFALPVSGADHGTYNPRSMIVAGPSMNTHENIHCSYWGFDAIDCDTSGTGADLGVQDDLQVGGTIFADNNIDFNNLYGVNLADPNDPQDAATKAYVDAQASGGIIDTNVWTENWLNDDNSLVQDWNWGNKMIWGRSYPAFGTNDLNLLPSNGDVLKYSAIGAIGAIGEYDGGWGLFTRNELDMTDVNINGIPSGYAIHINNDNYYEMIFGNVNTGIGAYIDTSIFGGNAIETLNGSYYSWISGTDGIDFAGGIFTGGTYTTYIGNGVIGLYTTDGLDTVEIMDGTNAIDIEMSNGSYGINIDDGSVYNVRLLDYLTGWGYTSTNSITGVDVNINGVPGNSPGLIATAGGNSVEIMLGTTGEGIVIDTTLFDAWSIYADGNAYFDDDLNSGRFCFNDGSGCLDTLPTPGGASIDTNFQTAGLSVSDINQPDTNFQTAGLSVADVNKHPMGANTYIQYYEDGNFNGDADLTYNSTTGAFRSGLTTSGTLTASGNGSSAQGYAQTGNIRATGSGAKAFGHALGSNPDIWAEDDGSLAYGYTNSGGDIWSRGDGSTASGYTGSLGIYAEGRGSFAQGDALSCYITASANGSQQFGCGTNSRINSTAFGTDFRFRHDGSTTSARNGDFTMNGDDVTIYSGNNWINLTDLNIQAYIGGASITDTNAETACSGLEYLAGDGTCQTIPTITDTNFETAGYTAAQILLDTNAQTACAAGEVLYGDGTCAAPSGAATRSFGSMYLSSEATTTITTGGTYQKFNGTTTLVSNIDFTMPTNNRLTYTGATDKNFLITVNASLRPEDKDNYFQIRIAENGTTITGSTITQESFDKIQNDEQGISTSYIVELSTNDYVELFGTWQSGRNGMDLDLVNMSFNITQIS